MNGLIKVTQELLELTKVLELIKLLDLVERMYVNTLRGSTMPYLNAFMDVKLISQSNSPN